MTLENRLARERFPTGFYVRIQDVIPKDKGRLEINKSAITAEGQFTDPTWAPAAVWSDTPNGCIEANINRWKVVRLVD